MRNSRSRRRTPVISGGTRQPAAHEHPVVAEQHPLFLDEEEEGGQARVPHPVRARGRCQHHQLETEDQRGRLRDRLARRLEAEGDGRHGGRSEANESRWKSRFIPLSAMLASIPFGDACSNIPFGDADLDTPSAMPILVDVGMFCKVGVESVAVEGVKGNVLQGGHGCGGHAGRGQHGTPKDAR